jgi:hypothetical protein
MWPRVAEIALGGWLVASLLVLEPDSIAMAWKLNNLACGVAVIVLAALSFWTRLSRAHLGEILVGLWLLGFAFAWPGSTSPSVQNAILVGLTVLNFAIIPSPASLPPRSWRDFYSRLSAP